MVAVFRIITLRGSHRLGHWIYLVVYALLSSQPKYELTIC